VEVDFLVFNNDGAHCQICLQKAFLISELNPAISAEIILFDWL
jgi:hypothetical protein